MSDIIAIDFEPLSSKKLKYSIKLMIAEPEVAGESLTLGGYTLTRVWHSDPLDYQI